MQHLDLEKDREILAALKISRSTIIAAVKNGVKKYKPRLIMARVRYTQPNSKIDHMCAG